MLLAQVAFELLHAEERGSPHHGDQLAGDQRGLTDKIC